MTCNCNRRAPGKTVWVPTTNPLGFAVTINEPIEKGTWMVPAIGLWAGLKVKPDGEPEIGGTIVRLLVPFVIPPFAVFVAFPVDIPLNRPPPVAPPFAVFATFPVDFTLNGPPLVAPPFAVSVAFLVDSLLSGAPVPVAAPVIVVTQSPSQEVIVRLGPLVI